MTTPASLLDTARALASEAGRLIVEGRAGGSAVAATKSSAIDIVTQMDLAAEELLRERIAHSRPGDGVLGEEGVDVASETGVTWVLDPIDGTVNYWYGLPHFAVSVAAVSGPPVPGRWTLEAGAVFVGGTGELFSAARGEGAWRDGERLRRDGGPELSQTLVSTGFQYIAERRELQARLLTRMIPQVRDIRRLGSCAVDLCLTAAGDVDAYYEHGLNAWDFAAGALIAQEAGLRVEGLRGRHADEFILIAAVPERFDELHDALLEAGADQMWGAPGAGV